MSLLYTVSPDEEIGSLGTSPQPTCSETLNLLGANTSSARGVVDHNLVLTLIDSCELGPLTLAFSNYQFDYARKYSSSVENTLLSEYCKKVFFNGN